MRILNLRDGGRMWIERSKFLVDGKQQEVSIPQEIQITIPSQTFEEYEEKLNRFIGMGYALVSSGSNNSVVLREPEKTVSSGYVDSFNMSQPVKDFIVAQLKAEGGFDEVLLPEGE